jgi:hypothetical protein
VLHRKRGRPRKYTDEQERKDADAARKRNAYPVERARDVIAEHPDDRGKIPGESSGNHGAAKMEAIVAGQQHAEAIGLGTNRDPDFPQYGPSDRRRVSVVPASSDDIVGKEETDGAFVERAFRRQNRSMRDWIHGKTKRPPCDQDHRRFAEQHKDSKVKLYCGRCRKLLVNPGKVVNFPEKGL